METFAGQGYTDGKIRTIAERAGVTHGTVSHHFASKRELFLLAHEHAARILVDGYNLVLVDCDTLAEELQAVLARSAEFMREQPCLTRLLVRAVADRSHPELYPLRFTVPLEQFIDGIAARGVARGELDRAGGVDFRYLLRALLWGLSIVGVDHPSARDASIHAFQRLFAATPAAPLNASTSSRTATSRRHCSA